MSVIITHFYNEELLLPYWLDHHTRLFDHGVLINYNSTDESVAICKKYAPDWEIIDSRNDMFYAERCDEEVMEIEARFSDWKMALNVTEFLMVPDINSYIELFLYHHPQETAFRAHGMAMVDPPDIAGTPLTDSPLIQQRHWGIDVKFRERDRIIHCNETGQYAIGRHQTNMERVLPPGDDVYCLWFGYSPYPQVKERVLQIQDRVPEHDRNLALGQEHIVTSEELDVRYEQHLVHTIDLLKNEGFLKVWTDTLQKLY